MAKAPRSLAGKVVAITGGARGIGRATAAALIAQGARVAIGDIDAPLAEQTASELGSGTVGLALDVTDRASFDGFLTEVESRIGPYPRNTCPHCMAVDIAWVTATGEGTLYSYTVIHRPPPGVDCTVPYAVGLVDLVEGVRLMVQLGIHQPRIGQPVRVEFRERNDGLPIPYCLEARL